MLLCFSAIVFQQRHQQQWDVNPPICDAVDIDDCSDVEPDSPPRTPVPRQTAAAAVTLCADVPGAADGREIQLPPTPPATDLSRTPSPPLSRLSALRQPPPPSPVQSRVLRQCCICAAGRRLQIPAGGSRLVCRPCLSFYRAVRPTWHPQNGLVQPFICRRHSRKCITNRL